MKSSQRAIRTTTERGPVGYVGPIPMVIFPFGEVMGRIQCGVDSPAPEACAVPASGSSNSSGSQYLFRITCKKSFSFPVFRPSATLCDKGVQSGCHSLTPSQVLFAAASNRFRLTGCPSRYKSRKRRLSMRSFRNRCTSECLVARASNRTNWFRYLASRRYYYRIVCAAPRCPSNHRNTQREHGYS